MTENYAFSHTCLNPQNILQARHIKSFWGAFDQKVYSNDWKYQQLVARINLKLKDFDAK